MSSKTKEPDPQPLEVAPAHTMDLPKRHNKGKIFLIVVWVLVLFTAVGAGTWYYMNQRAKKQQADMQNQINQLNQQLQDLQNSGSSSSQTKDWQNVSVTYNNASMMFKLPPGWTTKSTTDSNNGGISFYSPGYSNPSSSTPSKSTEVSGIATIASSDLGHGTIGPLKSSSDETINGTLYKKSVYEGSNDASNLLLQNVVYKMTQNSKYYNFEYTYSPTNTDNKSTMDTVVSTIKIQ